MIGGVEIAGIDILQLIEILKRRRRENGGIDASGGFVFERAAVNALSVFFHNNASLNILTCLLVIEDRASDIYYISGGIGNEFILRMLSLNIPLPLKCVQHLISPPLMGGD